MNRKQKKMLTRILVTAAVLVLLQVLPVTGRPRFLLYLAAYLLIGYDILKKAVLGIRNGRVLDENFLMAVATVGAFALAVLEKSGQYTEGVAVMLFYQIGELFQGIAVGKSRRSISSLMDIRPDHANLEEHGQLIQVDPEEVPVGTVIVIQPGERVPLDGTVIEGNSSLNTSPLTGESVPRTVRAGEEVISGCINQSGVLKVRTTKEFGESTVARILDLVENASSRKSRSEAFISRFARVYTPTVCLAAAAVGVIPPLVSLLTCAPANWSTWLYRALTFLVVSCPCALVISIPLGFFAGLGGAGKEGILVKGSNFLEALAQTACVVFDKTGTLTQGVFEVTGVHHSTMPDAQLVEVAALAECASSHPISKSLQRAYGRPVQRERVTDIQEDSGLGVTAMVDGHPVAVGNGRLMDQLKIPYRECSSAGTVVHVAVDGAYAGHIVISDLPKPNSAKAIAELKKNGVRKTVMLTGDRQKTAAATAEALGVDAYYGGLLPEDKVLHMEQILSEKGDRETVAFVGDGINDAPVLTRADVGIAMGTLGSDAAIEAADVVLMDDDPLKIVKAIRIAGKCMRIVRQNIVFSIAVKLLCLVLSAFGAANMWLAIFADVGVMILAVLNSIRALSVRDL